MRFLTGAFLILFALFSIAYVVFSKLNPTVNQSSDLIKKPIRSLYISAWLPNWDEDRAFGSLEKASKKLSTISPVWYLLDKGGKIKVLPTDFKDKILFTSTQNNIAVVPTIGNEFDPERVSDFLKKGSWSEDITDLINVAEKSGYVGWDLDWEQLNPDDKDLFSEFVKQFSINLHERNLKLFVTVHAKEGLPTDWFGSIAQDWEQIGKYSDRVNIMAYDYHNDNSDPGPITPINDLRDTLRYALKTLPIDKIAVGLPTYGYDWSMGKGASLQYEDAIKTIKDNLSSSSRDLDSGSLKSVYKDNKGVSHIMWFEDSNSMTQKVNIVKEMGIKNICFWRLGGEDLKFWEEIGEHD